MKNVKIYIDHQITIPLKKYEKQGRDNDNWHFVVAAMYLLFLKSSKLSL
jgi:hypothetical protein